MKEGIIKFSDKAVEYCSYGLIFFIAISNAGIEIFASFAILAFIIKKIFLPEFKFVKSKTHIFLLLFIVFSSLFLIHSGVYLKMSLEALFFKWGEYIFIFLIIEDTLVNRKRIRNAIAILLTMGGIVAIDALSQKFFGWEFLRGRQIKRGMYFITGPFSHHNSLAAYLVCILALMLALFSCTKFKNKIYHFGLFFIAILLGLSFLFTFSRGGWIGFIAVALLMLFLSRKWKVILPVTFIFILLVVLVPAIRERAIFIFQAGGDANRFSAWKGAWAMIKENPFLGKGLGTFMAYFPKYAPGLGIQYAHNSFLQIWAETGIFSLLSFLIFLGLLIYNGIKLCLGKCDFLILGILCALFGFIVHSFFDNQLYSLQLSVLFWLLLGILSALINSATNSFKEKE